jgi:hypothetical protein
MSPGHALVHDFEPIVPATHHQALLNGPPPPGRLPVRGKGHHHPGVPRPAEVWTGTPWDTTMSDRPTWAKTLYFDIKKGNHKGLPLQRLKPFT